MDKAPSFFFSFPFIFQNMDPLGTPFPTLVSRPQMGSPSVFPTVNKTLMPYNK